MAVRQLIDAHVASGQPASILLNDTDHDGRTALHYGALAAAYAGYSCGDDASAVIRYLLAIGADLQAKDCFGRTALHYAAGKKGTIRFVYF